MIEFTSNHHGIRVLENACKELVRTGAAKCVKDSRDGDFETERYTNDESKQEELKDRNFGVAVYRQYIIRVGRGLMFMPHVADIRFWYDERRKIAGIKISEESLIAIMQSTTVVNLLRKLDISLGGEKDGKITLEKVTSLLTKTMIKIAPDARTIFTAQKK
ncbi:hypothetical protein MUP46_00965 [Patescibacteria group bacterium]|nr:hypothetical protein [Patescibacteria group bacterium]